MFTPVFPYFSFKIDYKFHKTLVMIIPIIPKKNKKQTHFLW